jgi:hypothetical protein
LFKANLVAFSKERVIDSKWHVKIHVIQGAKMKKPYTTLLCCLFAIGLLTGACDDDLFDICTPNDAVYCTDKGTECRNGLDTESDTYEADLEECNAEQCDCLDDRECDQYLDEASCE